MLRNLVTIPTCIALALAALQAPSAAPVDYTTIPPDPAVVVQELQALKIALPAAIEIAEKEAGGRAIGARVLREGEAPSIEVEVYSSKVHSRVRIDARDGRVLERKDTPRFPGEVVAGNWTETPSGLKYYELKPGDGPSPSKPKQPVRLNIVGWLIDGTQFESTLERGVPTEAGIHQLVKGLEEGVRSMRVGGKRKFIVPYDLGYGVGGKPPLVPGKATLVFEVELLALP